jgi:hypothetical protein
MRPVVGLQVTELCSRPLFVFFVVELKSRKVIHVHDGQEFKYLIWDHDRVCGLHLASVETTSSTRVLRTTKSAVAGVAVQG